ncbi:bifunctional phosphopantothenoylcysteine decarboxylase/phosphopantothenate--cysteine ligase CoaBC [Litchfieldella xinjiangensis]|uniref:bifunctional phosphopantothenoylcysteine decarboxylase/phosphopantothenate--cysteine ligase CoaBC n=1 Tax=Litchfieldella xinjiangensis TaxID=1166948 RepID=UPI0005B8DC0C|nr:bifunctional phosphopantothenoylcysteine decarboxylase/phosphopantothenate--cysteine ligase CoaBC [Halomonas xinjiangensis]
MSTLLGKRILLGISAGIAAYKSAHLARLLKKAGAEVRVVMTDGAQAFITPLTLQALTGEAVRTSLLDPEAEAGMGHIELARWAELILVAPGTADLMARLANGMADDLLTTLCLASDAERAMAPAMNQAMWRHPATRRNAARLEADGWALLGPDAGDQACGDIGPGRMLEPEAIVARLSEGADHAARQDGTRRPANGLRFVITAGPTREPIDPVRYLSNHSSGKMGYALAEAAARLGAEVILISGPVSLTPPAGVRRIDVTTAEDMLEAATRHAVEADVFIGCAAVADYRVASPAEHKLKKQPGQDDLHLHLIQNPDIIAEVVRQRAGSWPLVVGFAAETRDLEAHARDKLSRKRLDMIVANDVAQEGLGFGSNDNAGLVLWPGADGVAECRELPKQTKQAMAATLIDTILERLDAHRRIIAAEQEPS